MRDAIGLTIPQLKKIIGRKGNIPSLKLTASLPLKIGRNPKGKDRLPTINFQVLLLLVSGRVMIKKKNAKIMRIKTWDLLRRAQFSSPWENGIPQRENGGISPSFIPKDFCQITRLQTTEPMTNHHKDH